MLCIKCKKEIPDDSIFCLYCGKKQSAAPRRKRHAKRPAGTGSIIKLPGKRQRPYQALLPAVWADGKALRTSLGTFATYEEAHAALHRALEAGRQIHEQTIDSVYQAFLSGNYFSALSESGQDSHRKAYRYMEPISKTVIADVTTMTFQQIVDGMRDRGLSRETMAKVRNLASLLCKDCMRCKLMSINFGQLVQLPKEEKTEKRSFSLRELAKIWSTAETGNQTAMAVILLCYTGMRPSELLGVRIEQHIRRRKSWTYIQTGSKTEAGLNRIIPVPDAALPFLEELRNGRDFGVLIPTASGLSWREENWRKRRFYPLMESLKIDGVVPYTCRHTYSNLQKRRDIDPEIMMEIMGHTDYATTVEHYHSTSNDDIERICSAASGLEAPREEFY